MDYSITLLGTGAPDDEVVFDSIPFLTDLGDLFEAGLGMVSDLGAFILSNPLLLCALVLPLVGLGIGIFKRLLNN